MDFTSQELFSPNFDEEIKIDALASIVSSKDLQESSIEKCIIDYLIGKPDGVKSFFSEVETARSKDRNAIAVLNNLLAKAILCLEGRLDDDSGLRAIEEAKALWLNNNPRYYSPFPCHEKSLLINNK